MSSLQCVNTRECVIEHFLEIFHAKDITSLLLKSSIDALFVKHSLNPIYVVKDMLGLSTCKMN